jgi:hypothetical protein
MIEIIALVLEDHLIGKDAESMGETPGDKELQMVLTAEFHGYMHAECGTSPADVDDNVEHPAFEDPYELAL